MAAFLTVDVLRAHAAPAFPCASFWRANEPVSPHPTPRPRPVLTAQWLVAPDGRLTCWWRTDVPASSGPPQH
jgi:hypothetical protein